MSRSRPPRPLAAAAERLQRGSHQTPRGDDGSDQAHEASAPRTHGAPAARKVPPDIFRHEAAARAQLPRQPTEAREKRAAEASVPAPLLLAVALNLLIGLSLGLLGGGGSLLAVPVLVYVARLPVHTAIGMSLAIVGTTALVGGVRHAPGA